jgi:hypothetical protein
MFDDGSWLQPISKLPPDSRGKPAYITYFENMSRAMAEQCIGVVYVMSDNPDKLIEYENIWGNVEWPTLAGRNKRGEGITNLYAVHSGNKSIYEIDLQTLKVIQWPRASLFSKRELLAKIWDGIRARLGWKKLVSRDTCDSNVANEPSGVDFFG